MSPAPADTAKSKDSKPSPEVELPTSEKDQQVTDGHNPLETLDASEPVTNSPSSRSDSAEGDSEDEGEVESDLNEEPKTDTTSDAPPLPEEEVPPLPDEEPPPAVPADDGWAPVWEETAQAFYFFNRFTGATQWTNPRVPEESAQPGPPGVTAAPQPALGEPPSSSRPAGGYDPAIHGDYDPTAWYAQPLEADGEAAIVPTEPAAMYTATGAFNRFTGRWQAAEIAPENFNDENKSKRQMNAFFDVDAAANSHDGRSLKAERSGKKLSKTELKQFKEKRKAKKEEKRRAWLRD